jgi:hypothetical protein
LIASIALPGVTGRIDHLAFDSSTERIFIADTNDILYHQKDSSIYTSFGAGCLDIIQQQGVNHYTQTEKRVSRSGAGTSLFVPPINRLVIAAPKGFGRSAALLVYEVRE